jgi:hypothetical protein
VGKPWDDWILQDDEAQMAHLNSYFSKYIRTDNAAFYGYGTPLPSTNDLIDQVKKVYPRRKRILPFLVQLVSPHK